MGFNADKCVVIRVTNKKRPLCSDYTIHIQKLNIKTEAKYIGVTISSDLSRSRYADNVTKKVNSTNGFLKRNMYLHHKLQMIPPTRHLSAPKWNMRLQPVHHSLIQPTIRLKWSSEEQPYLLQMTTAISAVSRR